VEDQATDRAHRIGQTKTVYGIKLITRGTVEEKVLALQEKKRAVISATVERDAAMVQSLTWQDVQDLLSLAPQARAVVFMREVEGRTYAEIAAAVGCREATARATAARARRRLRELLSREAQDATA